MPKYKEIILEWLVWIGLILCGLAMLWLFIFHPFYALIILFVLISLGHFFISTDKENRNINGIFTSFKKVGRVILGIVLFMVTGLAIHLGTCALSLWIFGWSICGSNDSGTQECDRQGCYREYDY